MDFSLYKDLNGFAADHEALGDLLRFFALDAQYLFVAILAALFVARGKWDSRNARHGVIAALLAAGLALLLAQVIAGVWDRPRPYEAHPGAAQLLIEASPDPSFPSDHAAAAFAIAVSLFLRNRTIGILTLAMAAILALSRVAVGTHYPTDVLGGAVLGTAAAAFLWLPPIRRMLNRLADWVGSVYDRIAARLLQRPSPT